MGSTHQVPTGHSWKAQWGTQGSVWTFRVYGPWTRTGLTHSILRDQWKIKLVGKGLDWMSEDLGLLPAGLLLSRMILD